MDLLKQLEAKLQSLVQQRNQLKEELDSLKSAGSGAAKELAELRRALEQAQTERTALVQERDDVKAQVASILGALESIG